MQYYKSKFPNNDSSIAETANWYKFRSEIGAEIKCMKTEQLQIRIDESLKNKSDRVFKKIGITRSYAITLFLTEIVKQKKFPFKINM